MKNDKRDEEDILLSAGEASGDFYGAGLIEAIKKKNPRLSFFGIGGEGMKRAGLEPVVEDISPLSQIGFIDVIRHLGKIRGIFESLVASATERTPRLALLIDLPGFNIRLAKKLKKKGIKVVYFVSPQVWAWRRSRIRKLKRSLARMLVLFPFEEELYRKEGVPARFVGHPLAEMVKPELSREEFLRKHNLKENEEIIGLLPGSRRKEVELILPPLIEGAEIIKKSRRNIRLLISKAPGISEGLIKRIAKDREIAITTKTYSLMSYSKLLLIASGTATLEAALLGTPMIVVYRLAPLNYLLARALVRTPFISLPNILAGRRVVPELIQKEAEGKRIAFSALQLLEDEKQIKEMKSTFAKIRRELHRPGAFSRAAEEVISLL